MYIKRCIDDEKGLLYRVSVYRDACFQTVGFRVNVSFSRKFLYLYPHKLNGFIHICPSNGLYLNRLKPKTMQISKKIIGLILFISFSLSAFAGHRLVAMRQVIPDSYNFLMYHPANYVESPTPKPLILFIHGASLCGNNLKRVMSYGVIHAIDRGLDVDALVVAPQNPGGSWKPEKLIRIVDYMQTNYQVDPNRIYVIGMSLGGFGTADFVGTYPDRIAAAMEICGGTTLNNLSGLAQVPLWILHGTADRAVRVGQARKMKEQIEAINGGKHLVYSELKGINHTQPARLFYRNETYDWLMKHTLDNRKVDRSYTITAKTVREPYSADIGRGGRLKLENGSKTERSSIQATAETSKQSNDSEQKATYHVIRRGDTLSALARKYRTTVKALCKLNGLHKTQTLRLGKRIRVS